MSYSEGSLDSSTEASVDSSFGEEEAEAGSSGGFVGRVPTLSEDTLTALMEYRCSDAQARLFLARSVSEHARRRVVYLVQHLLVPNLTRDQVQHV